MLRSAIRATIQLRYCWRMAQSLLVLGGSAFVGRALVLEAVARDWQVTTFNRGTGDWTHPGVHVVHGDRLDPAGLQPLREREWDLVVDTWSGAPRAVRDSAAALRDQLDVPGRSTSSHAVGTPRWAPSWRPATEPPAPMTPS